MSLKAINPFNLFIDNEGNPLEDGYIYIGTFGLEPSSNPVTIFYDKDSLYPAPNPVRTISGFVARDGSPANIWVESATYSIKITDKNGILISADLFLDNNIPSNVINSGNIDASDKVEINAKLGNEQWIIIGSQDNADYVTLSSYIASIPSSGDRALITENQIISAQLIIPSDITLRFVDGADLICNTNIATSLLQFGSNVIIEGVLNIILGHTGTVAKAVEYNGDNVVGRIDVENSSTGTLTTAHHINANKTGNRIDGFTSNTGGGTLTNVIVDNSTELSNYFIIVNDSDNTIYKSDGAGLVFLDNQFFIVDNGDNTKKLAFEVSSISTATTRTITVPDRDLTLDGYSHTSSVTAIANVSGSVGAIGSYIRIGDRVFVSGTLSIAPTAANTLTQFRIALPVASNFTLSTDLGGSGSMIYNNASYNPVVIFADTTNDAASFKYKSANAGGGEDIHYTFGYVIK